MNSDGDLAGSARWTTGHADPQADLLMWSERHAQDPGNVSSAIGLAKALSDLNLADKLQQLADSLKSDPRAQEQIFAIAAARPAQNQKLSMAWCASADARGDHLEAALRWQQIRDAIPRRAGVRIGLVGALLKCGRLDDAEAASTSAMIGFAENRALSALHAEVAAARGDWYESARRWQDVSDRFPDDTEAFAQHRQAAEKAVASGPEQPSKASLWESPEAIEVGKALIMQFESIGRNCEFGLLQRRFGAEPLGLLKFAFNRPRTLLHLLKTRFDGIGVPEQTEIVNVNYEYRIRHIPTDLTTHTHIRPDSQDETAVFKSQCRRLDFLRRKMLDDLAEPTKIFVYQKHDLSDELIREIFAALSAYGPNVLLCVREQTSSKPAGTFEVWEQRLMVAYIDHEGKERGPGWNISVGYWMEFCRLAYWHARDLLPLGEAPDRNAT